MDPVSLGAMLASGGAAAGTAAAGTAAAGAAAGGLFGTGITAMQALSFGTTLLSGIQQGRMAEASAKTQAEGMKAQAYQEKLKAAEEGNIRRERLLKALSSQRAAAGASGATGGSVAATQLESVSEFQKEQGMADLMANTTQSIYKQKISGALAEGKAAKRGALLSTAVDLTSIG